MEKYNITFDEATKTLIRTEQIDTNNASSVKEIKDSLNIELNMIVRQVKTLKLRAEEIKMLLGKLEEKTGSIEDPVL